MGKLNQKRLASWILAGVFLSFLVALFIFGPMELPPYKLRMLSLFAATFSGAIAFFLSGEIKLVATQQSKMGKLSIQAGGGIALFLVVFWYFESRFSPVRPQIRVPIFKGAVHLGDNIFAHVGGKSLPKVDDPLSQTGNTLIFYDKESEQFLTSFGLPTAVQIIANHYAPIFKEANLGAWKHIGVVTQEQDQREDYEGATALVDDSTKLIWKADATISGEGAYYTRVACVARTTTVNLYKSLQEARVSPDGKRLVGLTFWMTGMHGGLRPDQSDNCFDLIVNDYKYPLSFRSAELRTEEVVSVKLSTHSISLREDVPTMFSLVVRPLREKYPRSPPSGLEPREGPAHFRDVEIGDCFLEFSFEE